MNIGLRLTGLWLVLLLVFLLLTVNTTLGSSGIRAEGLLAAIAGVWLLVQGGYVAYRLLGLWVLLTALWQLLRLNFQYQGLVMAVLALVVAGLLLFSGIPRVRRETGVRLLALYLILLAAFALLSLSFAYSVYVTVGLGAVAGLFLLLRK